MKYPYEFNDDTELSAYEYALFMDEMEREDRDDRRIGSMSSMYDDDFDDYGAEDDDFDDDYNDDERGDVDWYV